MVIFLVISQDTAECGDREYFMELKKKEGLGCPCVSTGYTGFASENLKRLSLSHSGWNGISLLQCIQHQHHDH